MINAAKRLTGNRIEAGVVNCARCGGLHDGVVFVPFNRPPDEISHWAPCPKTGEPILFRITLEQGTPEAIADAPADCQAPRQHPAWCGCGARARG